MQQRMMGTLQAAVVGLAVLIGDAPKLVAAQQLPPARAVPSPAPLAGTRWMLEESAGKRVAAGGRQPHFELKALEHSEDGSVGQLEDATDACGNRLTGIYRATGDWLEVRIVSSTLAACAVREGMPRGLGATLTGDQRFRIQGAELDLLDRNGAITARFGSARGE